jgi:hypothetical protein
MHPKKKKDLLESFNPVKSAASVLVKCNVIRSPIAKLKKLRKGKGRRISSLEVHEPILQNKSLANSVIIED